MEKIGDFAKRSQTTIKALRYYDAYVKPGKNFLCKYFVNGTLERRLDESHYNTNKERLTANRSLFSIFINQPRN